jgi:hypothetical protein
MAIPAWLKPETAEHRVWLHGGAVHLLPLSKRLPAPLTAEAAVAAVRGAALETANAAVGAPVLARLAAFDAVPGGFQPHRARLYLPQALLRLLAVTPTAVAPAVEAFVSRDPIDTKLCAKMAAFPPAERGYGRVSFSRCLYAQLAGQRFTPPRAFGPLPDASSADFAAVDLGVKLACGFEILFQAGQRNLRRQAKQAPLEPAPEAAASRADYLAALAAVNFDLEDEEAFALACHAQMVEEEALNASVSGGGSEDENRGNSRSVQWAGRLAAGLAAGAALAPSAVDDGPADSDAWLEVSEADIESLLKARHEGMPAEGASAAGGGEAGQPSAGEAQELSSLAERFQAFMDGSSGLEGVGGDGAADAVDGAGGGGGEDVERASLDMRRMMKIVGAFGAGGGPGVGEGEGPGEDGMDAAEARDFYRLGGESESDSEGEGEDGGGDDEGIRSRVAECGAEGVDPERDEIQRAMDAVLAGTKDSTLGRSFARRPAPVPAEGAAARGAADAAGEAGEAMGPVDLDWNLVQNLLASYSFEQVRASSIAHQNRPACVCRAACFAAG